MNISRGAALLYTTVSVGVVAFQIALAVGVPWGEYAMGGASRRAWSRMVVSMLVYASQPPRVDKRSAG